MNTSTLYVLAQRWPYSGISLLSEDVYPDQVTAEAAKEESLKSEIIQKAPPIRVMTLEDYISEYGSARYDEGAGDERESASWNS